MSRITKKHLDRAVRILNEVAESPINYFVDPDNPDDRRTSIGHYCIDGAYGGWELHRIANKSGGAFAISSGGHIPARELYGQIQCAIEVARRMRESSIVKTDKA